MSPPPKAAVYCGFYYITGRFYPQQLCGHNLYNMPRQKKCHGLPIPRKSALKGMMTRCGRLCMDSVAGIIRTCFSYNGIQRKMPRIRPKRFLTAASGKCGGAAKKATPGRPLFTSGPAGPAAPTAQAGKWDMATTLHRCIRSLPRSGICGKMRRESRLTFPRGASALRGGSVRRDIPGGPRSNPGYPAAVARSVPTGLLWRVRIPWQMSLRSLCVNGMPRKTPH